MPEPVVDELRRKGWRFYTFMGGSARFMFAWDTETDRVRALSADIKQLALA
jgi:threonine aldolase